MRAQEIEQVSEVLHSRERPIDISKLSKLVLALCLWRILLFVTHSNWDFSWVFYKRLSSFEYHLHLFLLTFITAVCSERFPALVSRVLLKPVIWLLLQFNCLPRNTRSGCGESRNRLTTALYIFSCFCLAFTWLACSSFVGIFWVRFSLPFWMIFINFEKSFNLHIRNFLI